MLCFFSTLCLEKLAIDQFEVPEGRLCNSCNSFVTLAFLVFEPFARRFAAFTLTNELSLYRYEIYHAVFLDFFMEDCSLL